MFGVCKSLAKGGTFKRNGYLLQSKLKPSLFLINQRPYAEKISKMAKVGVVMQKAKSIADKLEASAAYINEDHVQAKYPDSQMNPFKLIEGDLDRLNDSIKQIISTQHPILSTIAQYYFNLKGKRIRPVLMILLARAMSFHVLSERLDVERDATDAPGGLRGEEDLERVTVRQSRLAEIIEMIHTASLIHDDVIDEADTRRNVPSVNIAFGNKVAILAGDFLLARASIELADLKNFEVTRLMSKVISDLVEGEFMQLKASKQSALDFDYYIEKTYYKTASLIANGCRATAVLGELPQELLEAAATFGKHFGLAFQLVDDLLDFVGNQEEVGKPIANDMKLGIATAPALYAMAEFPELRTLIERNFNQEGDVEMAYSLVFKSSGIEKNQKTSTRTHRNSH
eukprot:TRINITY_DN2479_c0_g1_i3.p1 TRINITY_DN2479_c0_g1~~TRINITY_DN2479_c0_g1_i3.p1  ORF type:complete len:399 (-),score=83.30 TRINITY_DN2479_c0_g1_i3:226-1422(-)